MGICPNLFFFFLKKNQFSLLLGLPEHSIRSDSFVSQPFPKGENYLGKATEEVSNCITSVFADKWENSDPDSPASTI